MHAGLDEDGVELPVPPGQESALRVHDVLDALDALPVEQRAVLLLIGVEDVSYAEAAQILGVPLGTVMSRLSRGRERLRRTMSGERVASHELAPIRRVK